MSFSMLQEGRWGPMKQTALALSHLVQTRFRHDALQIIGFNLSARRPHPRPSSPRPSRSGVQGTNLQHALMLASRHLRRHPEPSRSCSSSPTASRRPPRGRRTADVPLAGHQETVRATVAQVDELRRSGAPAQHLHARRRPGWRASSTRSPGARVGASSRPTSRGSASTSSPTTSEPAADGAEPAEIGRWRWPPTAMVARWGEHHDAAREPHRGLLRLRPARRRGPLWRSVPSLSSSPTRARGGSSTPGPGWAAVVSSPPRTYAECSSASRPAGCRGPSSGSTR